MRPLIPASALLAAVLASAPLSRAAVLEARADWGSYAQTLTSPGNPVGLALGLDLRSPLVAGSFASVMALQAVAPPAAFAVQPPAQQVAAVRAAVRAIASPLLRPAPPGVHPAAALRPEDLVRIDALAGALPAAERAAATAGVRAEFARRSASLEEAARRVSANFEARSGEEVPLTVAGAQFVGRSGLKPFDASAHPSVRSFVAATADQRLDRAIRFPDVRTARDWLVNAPLGLLGRVVQLPTQHIEGTIVMSRGEMIAKLTRAGEAMNPNQNHLPVMITRGRVTRKILGFDISVDAYYLLLSEIADNAAQAEDDLVGLHRTSLADALDVIRTGTFLAAPGRMTFLRKKDDATDVTNATSDAALVMRLGGKGFRRGRYFGKDAYAPVFETASLDSAARQVPKTVAADRHNSYMADFASAGLLRRIPFTAEDAAATLEFLEARRQAGLPDAVYRPMKSALENALGKVDDAPVGAK